VVDLEEIFSLERLHKDFRGRSAAKELMTYAPGRFIVWDNDKACNVLLSIKTQLSILSLHTLEVEGKDITCDIHS